MGAILRVFLTHQLRRNPIFNLGLLDIKYLKSYLIR